MLDPRIYRVAFLPAVAAVVLLMFSLEQGPEPLEGPVSTPVFQGRETARVARSIATTTPSRTPGSEGDQALADRVLERFGDVAGGEVAEQTYEGEFEGESVELRNVLLTLPGRRPELLVVVADRASATGQGATTSAAATAILMRLADELGNARHERTIVLASLPGSDSVSEGIDELVAGLPAPAGIEAALAISNPGVEQRNPPFVFPGRADPRSVPVTLIETADEIGSLQFEAEANPTNAWKQLSRLAIPVGVGDAAALAAQGVDAIGISGFGERTPDPDDAVPEAVSSDTVFAAGSTTLDLLLTLDERRGPIVPGPGSYLQIGDNLLPGWTIRVLALALILPALLAAVDAWFRDRRRDPRTARRALPWAAERVLLPLAAVVAVYALGFVGLIPNPDFPYEPGRVAVGAAGIIALVALASIVALVALLIRPLRTPLDVEPRTLAAGSGLLCAGGAIGIWVINPFMALLLAPLTHVWLLPARARGTPRIRACLVAIAVAAVPLLLATAQVASTFGLGLLDAPWQLLVLIGSGQVGLLATLLWSLLLGGLLATVAACRGGVSAPAPPAAPLAGPRGPSGAEPSGPVSRLSRTSGQFAKARAPGGRSTF